MSADYLFIGLGSNNLKDKAFSGRTKSFGLKILILTRKARIGTWAHDGKRMWQKSTSALPKTW